MQRTLIKSNGQKLMLKLNIGCGDSKIDGYINIDAERKCKPDIVLDITEEQLPHKANTVDEILFFHCIEHIRKLLHRKILLEFYRVLKNDSKLYITYPNFWECAQRWHANSSGRREFWEATLFGRQLYSGDYHVCAMSPEYLTALLYECGFEVLISKPEPDEAYNTMTIAAKSGKPMSFYEDIVAQDMQNMVVKEK